MAGASWWSSQHSFWIGSERLKSTSISDLWAWPPHWISPCHRSQNLEVRYWVFDRLCSVAIAWKSCIQLVIATSLTRAEFYAGMLSISAMSLTNLMSWEKVRLRCTSTMKLPLWWSTKTGPLCMPIILRSNISPFRNGELRKSLSCNTFRVLMLAMTWRKKLSVLVLHSWHAHRGMGHY